MSLSEVEALLNEISRIEQHPTSNEAVEIELIGEPF